jgi:aspartyl-tRNA(Asn)/glutamyl-tRNA(Gln) amidotransferase subunit C
MKIEVEQVARLARLGLSEEEKKLFGEQLARILGYAEILNKLPTEKTPPLTHTLPLKNVFREDKVFPCQNADDIMANAPDEEEHMFKVPKILE